MAAISANCWNNDQAGGGGGEQRKREEKNKTQYLEIVIGMKASAVAREGERREVGIILLFVWRRRRRPSKINRTG